MMTTGFKRKSVFALIVTLLLSMVMFVGVTIGEAKAQESENANVTIDVAGAFETVQGASVRTIADENGNYGIRFEIRMLSSEYEKFMNSSVYSDIQFGVTIIPEDYKDKYGDFTEENLFGDNAIYDLFDGIADSNNVANVICMTNGTLLKDTVVVEDENDPENTTKNYKSLYAAITTINEKNFTRPFVGVGFVSYKENGVQKYVVEESLSRSAAYVAQVEIESERYAEYDEVVQGALNDYLENPPIKLSATKGGADYDVSDIKAALADYKAGETLDITAAAVSARPTGYIVDMENSTLLSIVPLSGVANYKINYIPMSDCATTGNIAPYAVESGLVTLYSVVDKENALKSENGAIVMTGKTDAKMFLKFNDEFVKDLIAQGYTQMNIKFTATSTGEDSTAAWARLWTYENSTNGINDGTGISCKCTLAGNSYEKTLTISQTLIDAIDFENGEGLMFGSLQPGSTTRSTWTITDLEFAKPVKNYLGVNIAPFAVEDGLVSLFSMADKENTLKTENGAIVMTGKTNAKMFLKFNDEFVKDLISQGYTQMNIKFTATSTGTDGANIWARLWTYENSTQGVNGGTGFTCKCTLAGNSYDKSIIINQTLIDAIDFENGEGLMFGSLQPGSTTRSTWTITDLTFTKPAA